MIFYSLLLFNVPTSITLSPLPGIISYFLKISPDIARLHGIPPNPDYAERAGGTGSRTCGPLPIQLNIASSLDRNGHCYYGRMNSEGV